MTAIYHPLSHLVLKMALDGQLVDVRSVATMLSGVTFFMGSQARKEMAAYQIVAANVLDDMVRCGILVQRGQWFDPQCHEEGGPCFELKEGVPRQVLPVTSDGVRFAPRNG